jgi:hypothetical protein
MEQFSARRCGSSCFAGVETWLEIAGYVCIAEERDAVSATCGGIKRYRANRAK